MATAQDQLIEDIAGFTHDPLGFVLYAFEWGKGELSAFPEGPEDWQKEQLNRIGEKLKAGHPLGAIIQESISSGHGIGKSCEVAWLILWAMSTFEDTRGVVTANTDTQLRTKTWAELTKWHRLCITKDWFALTATAIYSNDPEHSRSWRIDIIPWSLENTEAFAGLHNKGKRIIVIFDEASAIPDKIYEVTEGALTDADTEILWLLYGNPTRNTGKFAETIGKSRHRWVSKQIDSREVRLTNKAKIAEWVADEGEDGDFVRVRVRGLPPRASMLEFIGVEDWEKCLDYKAQHFESEAVVLGVDCARFGDDSNVIYKRQGRKVWKLKTWRGLDTQQSASHLVEICQKENPDAVFVDGGGPGGGIIDRAKVLWNAEKIIEVNFGGEALNKADYANKRAEMWGEMRKAMRQGLDLPDENILRDDLLGPTYSFTGKEQILLERKRDMKKRGLSSPDDGDALALTFARPVVNQRMQSTDDAVKRTFAPARPKAFW